MKINGNQSACKGALVGVANHRLPKLHCRPADGMLDCKGPLSDAIAPNTLAEQRREACCRWLEENVGFVSLLHTQGDVQVVKYSSINGAM